MKGYAQKKKDKKWSVGKTKEVVSPTVTEVKDENGVIVREAKAEESIDIITLSKKRYDSETGKALVDIEERMSVKKCDEAVKSIDEQIAELTAQKEGWEALKADIESRLQVTIYKLEVRSIDFASETAEINIQYIQ